MLQVINKFVNDKENGLFLLDLPTGFGKTTAVLDFIENFVKNESNNQRKIFFITNLKINLPCDKLKERLGDDLFYDKCLLLESYYERVIKKWKYQHITQTTILRSDEYNKLSEDIEIYNQIDEEMKISSSSDENLKIRLKYKNDIENRIREKSEPEFRKFIKSTYFIGKSVVDKKKFIRENQWFRDLYPSVDIDKYSVLFMTTTKFFNSIDSFYRMPYYLYDDDITKNSIIFIDEFDSTKETILSNIIDEDMKTQIDLLKLFLNIYYSIMNLKLPTRFLKVSNFVKQQIDAGKDWKEPQEIIDLIKREFENKYNDNNFDFSLKSIDLDKNKSFLFYDGTSFTIVKDNSRKNIYTKVNKDAKYLNLYPNNQKYVKDKPIKKLITELNSSINYFTRGIVFLAENFQWLKNENLDINDTQYSFEECLMSIISLFNIDSEFVDFIFDRAVLYNKGKSLNDTEEVAEDNFMRKGFNFTEIEDDRYHDLQSKFHAFYFHTTPEDLILRLAVKSNVIGVSATATLDTVIGNYDIKYLEKKLQDNFCKISKEDEIRLKNAFNKTLEIYKKGNVNINNYAIDDIPQFSYEDKIYEIIKFRLFKDENKKEKWTKIFTDELTQKTNGRKKKDSAIYYQLIRFKLGLVYKYFCEHKEIHSFLCFLNFTVNTKSNVTFKELNDLFKDIAEDCGVQYVKPQSVYGANFKQEYNTSLSKLQQGEKIFWLSTYKTIGSGKNIQYKIPDAVKDNVILDGDREDKDFDGIYLSTPTNMSQVLYYDSPNKYKDLAMYLFEQEYLNKAGKINYFPMKQNIIRGFKKTFYNVEDIYYPNNDDILIHNAQIIIQAVGRICRCRNKNKEIHILTDVDVVDRLQKVQSIIKEGNYNLELTSILDTPITRKEVELAELSKINYNTFCEIRKKAWFVRRSYENVKEWQYIRDYVLRNPTTDNVVDDLKDYYFKFDDKYSGYSYHKNSKQEFDDFNLINKINSQQVSDSDCCLSALLEIPEVYKKFEEEKYAMSFKRGNYIMSQSLYQQVYKGALGEVVGKIILENGLGIDLEEIDDYTKYELFDFKHNNIYFDFKHWDDFIIDHNKYCDKIRKKLNRVNGEKCFIINLTVSRSTKYIRQEIQDGIYIIPFLINPETGEVDSETIEYIDEKI